MQHPTGHCLTKCQRWSSSTETASAHRGQQSLWHSSQNQTSTSESVSEHSSYESVQWNGIEKHSLRDIPHEGFVWIWQSWFHSHDICQWFGCVQCCAQGCAWGEKLMNCVGKWTCTITSLVCVCVCVCGGRGADGWRGNHCSSCYQCEHDDVFSYAPWTWFHRGSSISFAASGSARDASVYGSNHLFGGVMIIMIYLFSVFHEMQILICILTYLSL